VKDLNPIHASRLQMDTSASFPRFRKATPNGKANKIIMLIFKISCSQFSKEIIVVNDTATDFESQITLTNRIFVCFIKMMNVVVYGAILILYGGLALDSLDCRGQAKEAWSSDQGRRLSRRYKYMKIEI
jgi:hypothetical protein